ncbi:conserved exported protein of unknown function [Rhodovastum atsumiense]|uniref:DUF4412 domain-containing protein n=1 Tax=Rhodovastum atsumiense TaxID=504468 RepID=A0A5M6IVS8_9PROT|nr:hypothetical protein [Rhodovastum atsumiense]KAA5612433.1 hypothetical protein F1189_09665 [Rhodovastum atsumiense]CAH2600340.1 conserved exported protein of unknown function [Rhodovastum atsumiense]
MRNLPRMGGLAAGALAALVMAVGIARAAPRDRPVFPPTRDVAVTYATSLPQPGAPKQVLLRYSAASGLVRIDGALPGWILVDPRERRASVVMEQLGVLLDAPAKAGLDQALVLENGRHFTRRGSDQVAGLRCTVWDVAGEAASGTVCVTGDGVVLRASGHDRSGQESRVEATGVDYAAQPDALFQPPGHLRRVNMQALLDAGGLTGGLPSGGSAGAILDRLRGRQ